MSDQASELRRLMQDGVARSGKRAPWRIAITSGKGGVGKTTIALNLGLALAQAGVRAALMDADFGLSNVEVLLGIAPDRSLEDVVAGRLTLQQVVREVAFGLKLIPGASGVAGLANLEPAVRAHLLDQLAGLREMADVVLMDTSPGISDAVVDLAAEADEALIVTTPEPTSLTDAYASAKVLLQRRPDLPVGLVVNITPDRAAAREVASGFQKVTERFLGRGVPLKGYVCSDIHVADAVRRQVPLMVAYPRSVAAACLRGMALDLLTTGAFPSLSAAAMFEAALPPRSFAARGSEHGSI